MTQLQFFPRLLGIVKNSANKYIQFIIRYITVREILANIYTNSCRRLRIVLSKTFNMFAILLHVKCKERKPSSCSWGIKKRGPPAPEFALLASYGHLYWISLLSLKSMNLSLNRWMKPRTDVKTPINPCTTWSGHGYICSRTTKPHKNCSARLTSTSAIWVFDVKECR